MCLLGPCTAWLKWYRCKANGTFCFASSQVWSEHRMQTTSWDPCHAASLTKRTSRRPPATSHTSSTRARGTPGPSREATSLGCCRGDPQIQVTANHTDALSPRDRPAHRRSPPTTRLMKISTGAGQNSQVTSMVIPVATVTVTVTRESITTEAITATAIAMRTTTDVGRSRGNTSAGDGRNVCKGNFSF